MLYSFSRFDENEHAASAGGKGGTLAKLYQSGYPVPDGFIISAAAFDEQGLSAALRDRVLSHYRQLCGNEANVKVAVRSSGLAEDSNSASFAGEFETVLNVGSEAELFDAIQTVFDSAHSGRIADYAAAMAESEQQRLAVVVQRMLEPSYAGVLFTRDPVSGDDSVMPGNLTEGLADKLVAGEVSGETFTLRSDSGAYDGPDYFEAHAQALHAMATRLLAELKAPQDIEWAVCEDRLFLLQSRPITGTKRLPEIWNDSLKGNFLWSNTNLGELFGNVVTPYTWSVFLEVQRRNVGPVGNHCMIGLIGGRVYFNISLIYSILQKLGKQHQAILGSFDLFLGNIPDHVPIPKIELTWRETLGFIAGQIRHSLKSALGMKKFLIWLQQDCPAWCEAKMSAIEQCQNNNELLKVYQDIEPVLFKTFLMVAFIGNQFVQQQYKLKSALSPVLAPEQLAVILSGLDGGGRLQSLAPLLGVSALHKGEISREEFVLRYGHRGPNEAEYAAPRTAEDPEWIEKLIEQSRDAAPEQLLSQQKENRERIWRLLSEQQPKLAESLRKQCELAAEFAHQRELAKSENFRQAWVVRRFVQQAARLNGLSDDALFFLKYDEVVDFLRGDREVLARIAPRQESYQAYEALPALPNLISGPVDPVRWAQSPDRRTDYFDANQAEAVRDDQNLLKGFPGSAGLVEGTVRVLATHERMDEFVSGEVLVTSFTNVGWTPLFPRASAIVTDIGAPLSHAAIVARELGVPAVVGTGSATMKLKTGDRVRVDGSRGIVELLSPCSER